MRRCWRALSVFPGTFDEAAASGSAGFERRLPGPRADGASDALHELWAWSLAEYDEASARYRLQDLARIFAGERLQAAGSEGGQDERDVFDRRHARHFQRVLAEADDLYLAGEDKVKDGLALFDRKRKNIEAGLAWAEQRDRMLCRQLPRRANSYKAVLRNA